MPIGHEVGVTALQLASAISVIANGGVLMRPYIVKAIQGADGELIKEFEPQLIRKVISPETAERVRDILVMATEEGTGKSARVEDFKTAGKTGTAQKIEPNGAYSHSKYIASFIGFAPADDPLIAVVVTVDEPRPYYFGGVVAAPVFKRIAQDAVKYLKLRKASNAIGEIAKRISPDYSAKADLEISGIFVNSKEVKDKSLFVAVKGAKVDGSGLLPRQSGTGQSA